MALIWLKMAHRDNSTALLLLLLWHPCCCRIEVGTETGVDRSKSVMSYLVQYFNEAGNYTVQVRLCCSWDIAEIIVEILLQL